MAPSNLLRAWAVRTFVRLLCVAAEARPLIFKPKRPCFAGTFLVWAVLGSHQ